MCPLLPIGRSLKHTKSIDTRVRGTASDASELPHQATLAVSQMPQSSQDGLRKSPDTDHPSPQQPQPRPHPTAPPDAATGVEGRTPYFTGALLYKRIQIFTSRQFLHFAQLERG